MTTPARLVVALFMLASTAAAVPRAGAAAPVELVTTIAAPGVISGRVVLESGRPRWFYLSTLAGLVIYDIATPAAPREVGRLPLPTYQNEDIDGTGELALLAADVPVSGDGTPVGGQVTLISTKDKTRPSPVAMASLTSGAGHTTTCLDGCRWAYASGGGRLAVLDLRQPTAPVVSSLKLPVATGIVHDGEQDRDGVLWLAGANGMVALATRPISSLGARVRKLTAHATATRPVELTSTGAPGTSGATRAGTLHGSLRPLDIGYRGFARGDVVLAAEESTADECRDGGRFHTFDARGLRTGARLRLLDSVAPDEKTAAAVPAGLGRGCSAHWFTTSGPLVAVAWFGGGVRVLDVSDPRRVRQVGRYVPTEPRTWAAYWIANTPYVYALDLDRGIDVLRVNARAGGAEVAPLVHGLSPAAALNEQIAATLCR